MVTIDGRAVPADGAATLLELARRNGIVIPALCDHPDLKPFTGCRLCLVEIEGRNGLAPACGTKPEDGMVVRTDTEELRGLRREILGLILTEHPHACLICAEKASCDDLKSTIRKAGEVTGCVQCPNNRRCDLQDVVEAVGLTSMTYPAAFRNLEVRRGDPFFERDPNTCILCGKCVRVCEEVRGNSVLTFAFRGGSTVVSTAMERPLLDSGCRFCGACVDACPTASLFERAVKSQPLPDGTGETVCPFCAQGCRLELGLGNGRVLFSRPSREGPVNRGQGCVRGRFLVRETVGSARRITEPRVRRDGKLVAVAWEEALTEAAAAFGRFRGDQTAVLFSPEATLEDAFVFYVFARDVLDSTLIAGGAFPSVWAKWSELGRRHGGAFPLRATLADIASAETIIVVGADLAVDHPIAWVRVVEAMNRGARLVTAGPVSRSAGRSEMVHIECLPGREHAALDALAKRLEGDRKSPVPETAGIHARNLGKAAEVLAAGKPAILLLDSYLTAGPEGLRVLAASWNLARAVGAGILPLGRGANERGIFELERAAFPGERTKPAAFIADGLETGTVKALVLAGAARELGAARPEVLVAIDTHWSPQVEAADIVLPSAAFTESGGTFVNTEGRVQGFGAALPPAGSALPDWRIVSLLGRKMKGPDFGFDDAPGLRARMAASVPALSDLATGPDGTAPSFFIRETGTDLPGEIPVGDSGPGSAAGPEYPFVLAARPSGVYYRSFDQAAEIRGFGRLCKPGQIVINPADAVRLRVKRGDLVEVASPWASVDGRVEISAQVPEGAAEARLAVGKPGEWDFLRRRISPVAIRRMTR